MSEKLSLCASLHKSCAISVSVRSPHLPAHLSFKAIREITKHLNDLDNHSHFDSIKHSKGYISEAEMTNSRVEGSSGRAARKLRFALMGPAFIAAIGYIDPGNFATNIQAGASFGYKLLWVVVWANLMAMLIQMLSAKLGLPRVKTWRSKFATIIRVRWSGFTGCRRKSSPWPPISLNLSAQRSALS
jgi:hypothetical protein